MIRLQVHCARGIRHSITGQGRFNAVRPWTWMVAVKFEADPPARKAKPFLQRRTLLAQQLLFRCGEFLEFSFIHFRIRQIE